MDTDKLDEAPSSKLQIPKKHQAPSSNGRVQRNWSLGFGASLEVEGFSALVCTRKRAVSGNPELSDGTMKPDKSSCGSRASAARPGEDKRASQRGGFFPLTPALSRWERVKPALPGVQSTQVGFPLREARCSLSPRERVRVRGNGANYHLACWTNSRTINESSGRVMGFPQRTV